MKKCERLLIVSMFVKVLSAEHGLSGLYLSCNMIKQCGILSLLMTLISLGIHLRSVVFAWRRLRCLGS